MLTKKKITKLLHSEFRQSILKPFNHEAKITKLIADKKIAAYARYIVDSQIIHRAKQYENDKTANYGFSPIYPICAVLNNGSIDKKFLEFNIVNHFLKEKDGNSAIEVVMCILIEWCKEDKNIKDFDINVIDAELAKIEQEYLAKQKQDKELDNKDT